MHAFASDLPLTRREFCCEVYFAIVHYIQELRCCWARHTMWRVWL